MESVQSGRPLILVSLLPHEQKVWHPTDICVWIYNRHTGSIIGIDFSLASFFTPCTDVSDARLGEETPEQHGADQI